MNPYRIWLSPPHLNGKEKELLLQAIDSNWISTVGPALEEFEFLLSQFAQTEASCCTNSGTSAIHLALLALGVKKNAVVICPSLTFAATANPIIYQGAEPVFVDSEPFSWNISPDWLEIAIKDCILKGKKPKAIIVVHLYGNAANMIEIMKIANSYGIPVIEDAAEALGSIGWNKKLGSFGAAGIFSFNGNKIITTSSGGAIVASQKICSTALYFASQAKSNFPYYHHENIGFNYRMSNVLAALGVAQFQSLSQKVQKRREIFQIYQHSFQKLSFQFPREYEHTHSNRWLSVFLLPDISPEKVISELANLEIESRRVWKPLHLQPVFQHCKFYGDHTCQEIFEKGICLPSGSSLQLFEQQEIIDCILNLY